MTPATWAWVPWVVHGPTPGTLLRGPMPGTLWLEALEVAGAIWDIVRKALHRGAVIRWFEFGKTSTFPFAGGEQWLRPVNAARTLKVQRTKRYLRWLYLTAKNEEALVLVGEGGGDEPVLFASDSDLSFDPKEIPKQTMLITAPHHGALANRTAYAAVSAHTGHADHVWIRSDGPSQGFVGRPCPEFTAAAPQARRGCTECHQCGRRPTGAVVATAAGAWSITSGTCPK